MSRERNKNDRLALYADVLGVYANTPSIEDLDFLGYFDAPASTKYHGNYAGGLFNHSLSVTMELVELTKKLGLKWTREESPYIVGMFHDLCKCDLYYYDLESDSYKYNQDLIINGHGEKSVIMLQKMMNLTDEEIACIRWHMGAYETDTKLWNYYNNAIKMYPNVLYTHTADMIASQIIGV